MDFRGRRGIRAQNMRDRVALGYASSAIHSAPPRAGEVRRTRVPDDFNGIRFEIARMEEYVREGRKDPLIIDTARQAVANWGRFVEEMSARRGEPISAHNNKTLQAEGCDIFCRHYFYYVNDPTNVEVIQTPRRMVKQTKVPREVLAHIMEPFYRAMEEEDPDFDRATYEPPPMYIGDCIPLDQRIITRRRQDNRYEKVPAGLLKWDWKHRDVVSYNEESGAFEFKPITRFLDKGSLPVYRVRLSNGTEFRCTENHKLYAFKYDPKRKGHDLVTLTLGELLKERKTRRRSWYTLACAARIPAASEARSVSSSQLWIEGLYAAEGWSEKQGHGGITRNRGGKRTYRSKIGMNEPHAIGALKTHLAAIGQEYGEHVRKDGLVTIRMNRSGFTDRLAVRFGDNSADKRFPDEYMSLSRDEMATLVGAYSLGDGFVPTHGRWENKAHLVHNTKSERLAEQLRFAHLILGRPLSGHRQRAWKTKPVMHRLFEYKLSRDRKRPDLVSSRIRDVVPDGTTPCCDLTVADNANFVLENGSLVHNCDEPHALFLAMCASLDITPVHYRFGGFDGMIHHVWGRVKCDGNWYDCDLTEPGFRFGDFSPFEHYEELEVKL